LVAIGANIRKKWKLLVQAKTLKKKKRERKNREGRLSPDLLTFRHGCSTRKMTRSGGKSRVRGNKNKW